MQRRHNHIYCHALLRENFFQSLCRASAFCGNNNRPFVRQQLLNALGCCLCITRDWTPTRGLHRRGINCLGWKRQRSSSQCCCRAEESVDFGMKARKSFLGITCPSRCKCSSKIVFFCEQVMCAVAHASRFDQHQFAVILQNIGEQQIFFNQPWQPTLHAIEVAAVGQSVPMLTTPRLGGNQ